jgi:hypothetical protein
MVVILVNCERGSEQYLQKPPESIVLTRNLAVNVGRPLPVQLQTQQHMRQTFPSDGAPFGSDVEVLDLNRLKNPSTYKAR